MTRDEAIKAVADGNRKRQHYCGIVSYEADAEVFVDNLAALGMLEFTRPETPENIAFQVLANFCGSKADAALEMLKHRGLKIIKG